MRGFRQGLHNRSPLVLAAGVVLAVAALLVFRYAFERGAITAVPKERLLRIVNDDYVHVSYRATQLKRRPPARPTVYLFGGSGAMEALVSEASLAGALRRAGGGRVGVVSLAAHGQSLAQTLVLVDNLPPGPGVVAVGLTPMRFTQSAAADAGLLSGRPILLSSPRLERLAPALYGETASVGGLLPGVFDYVGAYLRVRGIDGPLWGIGIPYEPHYYPEGAKGARPEAKRRHVPEVLARDRRLYRENGDYNFVVLAEIVKLAKERGYTVVFWDQPLNTDAADAGWGGVVPAYQARAAELAAARGVTYLHVERGLRLRDADFADLYHLLHHGRVKWQARMAHKLARVTRALSGAAGGR